jgi:hypothetical protein
MFKPKMPKIEPPPPAPTTDEAKMREIESKRLQRRRGRMSSMVSTEGSRAMGGVGTSKLLGG